jgi:Amt family ammonium transporter
MHGGSSYSEFQTTIFRFKDKSGSESHMEMRVRAGDAARFAIVLSDIMEASVKYSPPSSRGESRSDSPRSSAQHEERARQPMTLGSANMSPPQLTINET